MSEVTKEAPRVRQICSTIAQERGLDPIGGAYPYDYFLLLEAPLPWPTDKFREPEVLGESIIKLFSEVMFVKYPEQWMSVCLCVIAPDKGYSVPGMRRVIYGRRPDGPFAEFEAQEYLVPEAEMAGLAWALFARPEELPNFDQWRQAREGVRDYFVCTDGLVDRACAVVGMKLYSTLRKLPESQPGGTARIWKTSHFGGHVYAATLFSFPDGRMWGFLDGTTGPALVRREGEIAMLRGCYRGWIGAPASFINVIERELMMRHGWAWFDYLQAGHVLNEDPDPPMSKYNHPKPRWGEVEVRYHSRAGDIQGSATARVEVSHHVDTFYASDNLETIEYAQYKIQDLTFKDG